MVFFNGSVTVKIYEAVELRPTDFATRHSVTKTPQLIDPYISIDIDDNHFAKTTTRQRTTKPTYNEEYGTEVHNGQQIGLTVFHDAAIPPDEFVANCSIAFEDLAGQPASDIWVKLHYIFMQK